MSEFKKHCTNRYLGPLFISMTPTKNERTKAGIVKRVIDKMVNVIKLCASVSLPIIYLIAITYAVVPNQDIFGLNLAYMDC